MNEINSLILQAVDTVVNARLAKQNKDMTIIAQIVENNDAMFGKYVVKYQNANLNVVCNDTSKIYKKEENVYVLIPNGDMGSSQKFILGSAKSSSASTNPYVEITDPNQRYELMGPPVFNLIDPDFNKDKEWGIPGYVKYDTDKNVWVYAAEENDNKLIEYSKQYEYLQFSADFKYQPLLNIINCGNYGLEIGFFMNKDKDKIITYRFDTESMYGDPYHAYGYTNRAVTIKCEKESIYDLAYISLFSENFEREIETDENEIFIKNINIQFARLRVETDDYNANILTPNGIFIDRSLELSEGKRCIQLVPQMKYKGTALTSGVEFLWFEKDPSVDTNPDNGYHPLGKRGWKIINDTPPLSNDNKLVYSENNSWYNKTIKLVAKYTNNIIREEQIVIYQSADSFILVKEEDLNAGNINLIVKTKDNELIPEDSNYSFKWEQIEKNQHTMTNNEWTGSKITLKIEDIKIYNNCTYRCYIFNADNNLIGILEYYLAFTIEAQEDIQVVFHFLDNNNGSFLYNENGCIDIEELKPRALSFSVWRGSAELTTYKYAWILPGEDPPSDEINGEYIPDDSMLIFLSTGQLAGEYTPSQKQEEIALQYKIRPTFKRDALNNTVILEIIYNGTTKRFPYTFGFSKQGDPGTNGTDYQVRVKQTQILTNNQPAKYKLEVYENGEIVTVDATDITIAIDKKYSSQSLLTDEGNDGLEFDIDNNEITIYKKRAFAEQLVYNIVNLIIKVNQQYKIEYVLPVQYYTGTISNDYFNMDNFYIVYDSAGRSPSYPDATIKSLYTGDPEDINNITQLNTSCLINYDSEKDTIKVKNYYQSTESVSILKAQVGTNYYYIPLVATINRFSLMHINEWDGNNVEVSTDGGYIYAPQIGAGHKDTTKNTFTGVIMGEYFIDQASKGVGLWGFDDGESSFGFNSNGTAYIGKSSVARLNFDGDEGYIENNGYVKNTSGMRIDFSNGSIYAPSFTFETNDTKDGDRTLFQFDLYDNKSKFLIRAKHGEKTVDIFKATGSDEQNAQQYFLQSVNYLINNDETVDTGLKIDLVNGNLRSSQFNINGSTGNASFNGTLKAASGTFAGKLSGAEGQFSGTIYAESGQIGGWAITDDGLRGGTLTKKTEKVKDDYGHEYTKTTYTGTGTLLGKNGNITISGNFESTGGDINLNGITIDAATGTNPGALIFQSDDKTAKISLKGRKVIGVNADGSPDYGKDDSSHTSGAMQLTADAGIAIETDGTLYLRSKGKVDGKDVFSSITMKDGQISLHPYASAVAVFG